MESEHQQRQPKGYSKLAGFMVHRNHVIVKQFRELAVKDLLYLQAELCDLQYDFDHQSRIDVNSQNEKTRLYDREWCHLRYAAGGGGKQWQLALQIREKLREYYSAIQQYQNVRALPQPSNRRREIVHSYTLSSTLGGDCDFLGRDLSNVFPYPSVYSNQHRNDMVFLGDEPGNDDFLARFIVGPALKAFHICWRSMKTPVPDLESQGPGAYTTLYQYSDTKIRIVVHTLGSIMSTIVPMVSIIVLYSVDSMPLRLGLVSIFSVIFSAAMSLVTNAKRVEIFAAVAAFASVQVVFISTTRNP
ncbi:uncharacterized protein GGS22DRAFT_194807 [Annulohypoxylon maeteangense]|uniref:uncharacterized protein n=1 Tax=Annulohypoxylon maeteangense TaxID=1927788 RepID=UPI002008A08E|nr:uncharacterized protein GGS22DRAFT_194807 [Annulohypoxylon maeteangense]KAI0884242.1 hypothetical protein GGS22DRAFT_194807 [Annulohypoxylon maeteangense]